MSQPVTNKRVARRSARRFAALRSSALVPLVGCSGQIRAGTDCPSWQSHSGGRGQPLGRQP